MPSRVAVLKNRALVHEPEKLKFTKITRHKIRVSHFDAF